jgi:hypothetical protein
MSDSAPKAKRVSRSRTPSRAGSKKPSQPKTPVAQGVRKPFAFDEFPDDPVFSVDITGKQGIGKTHFACTFPKPLIICDTEFKAYTTASKFDGVHWKRIKVFDDIRQAVYHAVDNDEIKTVVIDSGADLVSLASEEWCKENNKKSVFPITNYKHVYAKIDELVLLLEESRKWFVSTSRLKDEWVGDTSTGRKIRDGYRKFPWSLSLNLWIRHGIRDKKGTWFFKDKRFAEVTKNNMFGVDEITQKTEAKPYLFVMSYDGVVEELTKRWEANPLYSERENVCVEESKEWMKQYQTTQPEP